MVIVTCGDLVIVVLDRDLYVEARSLQSTIDPSRSMQNPSSFALEGLPEACHQGEVIPSEDPQHLGPYSLTIVLYNSCESVSGNST